MKEQLKSKKSRKFMWYGWQKDAANHFIVDSTTIERWRSEKGQGDAVAMRRNELIEWCKGKLRSVGKTEEEIQEKVREAFGEC